MSTDDGKWSNTLPLEVVPLKIMATWLPGYKATELHGLRMRSSYVATELQGYVAKELHGLNSEVYVYSCVMWLRSYGATHPKPQILDVFWSGRVRKVCVVFVILLVWLLVCTVSFICFKSYYLLSRT